MIAGDVPDPIHATIVAHLGAGVAKPMFALVVLAFIAGIAAVQASVSRVLFAFARDRELPASAAARAPVRARAPAPRNAVGASAVAAAAFLLVALSDDAYATLISMATVGFYIAFAFPVLAALGAPTRAGAGRAASGTAAAGASAITRVCRGLARVRDRQHRLAAPARYAPGTSTTVRYWMVALVAVAGIAVRSVLRPESERGRSAEPAAAAVAEPGATR